MRDMVAATTVLNGFEALPERRRQWFLDRLQRLPRAPVSGRRAAAGTAA